MNPDLLVRRMYVVCNHVKDEAEVTVAADSKPVQLDMFTDYTALEKEQEAEKAARDRERKQQEVVLAIKEKWGKNAILRGTSFSEGATARDRNQQVGGHKA
jgi:DNA polymerase V